MDQLTSALRLPVRFVHDPSTDRWSFSIEIPPISGRDCGCREVAERSAIAALRRHLCSPVVPRSDGEQVGHLSVTLGPVVRNEPAAAAVAPPAAATTAPARLGFHPYAGRPPMCPASVADPAPQIARPAPATAPIAERPHTSFGFHPHAGRKVVNRDRQDAVDSVTLVGRRAAHLGREA